jgi:Carbohydrate esterase 2 N-terminal/GDSL-like Lipase/Acylhydrolase family
MGDPKCEWTASSVVLKFQGTDLNAQLEDPGNNYWEVEIDGKPAEKIALGTGSHLYKIASGLTAGEHLVRLVRATEAYNGATQIHGFQLNQGGALLPVSAPVHRLEVIGDSISCGDSNEGVPNVNNPSNVAENGYFSYGAIAARNLDADYACVAWSGRTLWPRNTVPELYDRILPTDAKGPTWDFSKWTPDAIVINLSTNDFGYGPVDQAAWDKAYENFIAVLRGHFPNAAIYCGTSVMLPADKLAASKTAINQVVHDLNSAGDPNVRYLEFASEDWKNGGVGGHGHPSVKTDQIMADKVTAQITKDLGWSAPAPQ